MQLLRYYVCAAALLVCNVQAYRVFIQRQASVPACAEECLTTTPLNGCAPSNATCLCSDSTVVNALESCIEGTCDQQDITTSLEIIQEDCEAVGIPTDTK